MPPPVKTFAEALAETGAGKRHLLLGNGFSIALFPDFRYDSLLETTDFRRLPEARRAFDQLGTTDFEAVIRALRAAAALLPLYSADADAVARMQDHAEALKELLIQAIAGRHPARPSEIREEQYRACRAFLAHFVGETRRRRVAGGKVKDLRGNIYTLNYDLLLYWTLLHDEVVNWNAADPLATELEQTEPLEHDDGFRAPAADPTAPYVTWDAEGGGAHSQNIHFLHGGLHLYDYGPELQKKCWERSGGIPLVNQIRAALNAGKFPLFVSEGDSAGKLTRIRHSGYLQRSLQSFAGVCHNPGAGGSLFIFGHSLAPNDDHVLQHIAHARDAQVYISLYGDPDSEGNKQIIRHAQQFSALRNGRHPPTVAFFDAASAAVWG